MCSQNIFFALGFCVGLPQNLGLDFSVYQWWSLIADSTVRRTTQINEGATKTCTASIRVGAGEATALRDFTVQVEPGAPSGAKYTFKAQGHQDPGRPPGRSSQISGHTTFIHLKPFLIFVFFPTFQNFRMEIRVPLTLTSFRYCYYIFDGLRRLGKPVDRRGDAISMSVKTITGARVGTIGPRVYKI